MNKLKKAATSITIGLVIKTIHLAATLTSCQKQEPPVVTPSKEEILIDQEVDISYAFKGNNQFLKSITLEERCDAEGNPYYVGVIDKDTEALVADLVDYYNADPNTTSSITTKDVLYCITDGIVKATSRKQSESSFWKFLKWCKQPADLVYKEEVIYGNGTEYSAGEKATMGGVTNYDYIKYRIDDYSNYTYPWLYDAP
jgi:hypothetical protein